MEVNDADGAALRAFLADRDVPCPGCGYNLRGLTTERCPECAERLALRVAAHVPWSRGFIAGVIGLASGAGFSGLLVVYALIRMAQTGRGSPPRGFLLIVLLGATIQSLLLTVLLNSKASFRTMSPLKRGWLVAGCWALTLINLIVFAIFIN